MIKSFYVGLAILVLAPAGTGLGFNRDSHADENWRNGSSVYLHLAQGMVPTNSEDHYNIAAKARRIAAAIRGLDVVLPQAGLLDLTDELAAVGIDPVDAVPDYADKSKCLTEKELSDLNGL